MLIATVTIAKDRAWKINKLTNKSNCKQVVPSREYPTPTYKSNNFFWLLKRGILLSGKIRSRDFTLFHFINVLTRFLGFFRFSHTIYCRTNCIHLIVDIDASNLNQDWPDPSKVVGERDAEHDGDGTVVAHPATVLRRRTFAFDDRQADIGWIVGKERTTLEDAKELNGLGWIDFYLHTKISSLNVNCKFKKWFGF